MVSRSHINFLKTVLETGHVPWSTAPEQHCRPYTPRRLAWWDGSLQPCALFGVELLERGLKGQLEGSRADKRAGWKSEWSWQDSALRQPLSAHRAPDKWWGLSEQEVSADSDPGRRFVLRVSDFSDLITSSSGLRP